MLRRRLLCSSLVSATLFCALAATAQTPAEVPAQSKGSSATAASSEVAPKGDAPSSGAETESAAPAASEDRGAASPESEAATGSEADSSPAQKSNGAGSSAASESVPAETRSAEYDYQSLGEPSSTPACKARALLLGARFGTWQRFADNERGDYDVGWLLDGFARLPWKSWLSLRAMGGYGQMGMTTSSGSLGVPGVTLHQSPLRLVRLELRAEATWQVRPRLGLWAGPGISWSHAFADAETSSAPLSLYTARRSASFLDATLAVGADWEAIPNWLFVGGELGGARSLGQGGTLFRHVQGFDAEGHRHFVEGLPKGPYAWSGLVSVGVLL